MYSIRYLWKSNVSTELLSSFPNTLNYCRRTRWKKSSLSNNIGVQRSEVNKFDLENVSFGKLSSRQKGVEHEIVTFSYTRLIKPTVFTIVFCSVSFVGATIWQYENMKKHARTLIIKKDTVLWFKDKFKQMRQKQGSFRQTMNNWWASMTDARKLYFGIAFLNSVVLLSWKIRSFEPFLSRYFCSSPVARAVCWPMLLANFSHFSGLHYFANMFVLNSFIDGIATNLGPEQFLAFYLSAGVFSSWASYVHRLVMKQSSVSLGASGAIMGIIAYFSLKNPDALLQIIFLPFFTFKAGVAIKAIMLFDLTGLLVGWKLFDHAAHLGGAIFGVFWCKWGNEHIWKKRGPLLEWWHNYRTTPPS